MIKCKRIQEKWRVDLMNEKKRTYFICASIIISSIILGLFIYKGIYDGFDVLGQFINDGLRVISSNISTVGNNISTNISNNR